MYEESLLTPGVIQPARRAWWSKFILSMQRPDLHWRLIVRVCGIVMAARGRAVAERVPEVSVRKDIFRPEDMLFLPLKDTGPGVHTNGF